MSHVYGILGSVGTFISLCIAVFSYYRLENEQAHDLSTILITFTGLSLAVTVTFFFFTRAYAGQLDRNARKLAEFDRMARNVLNMKTRSELMAQTYHNVIHHSRQLLLDLTCCIEENAALISPPAERKRSKKKRVLDDEARSRIKKTTQALERFMCLLTSNIKTVADTILDVNTSVTIKRLTPPESKESTNAVHTFWRDSVSERKRRVSDITSSGLRFSYSTNDNTAFQLIVDPNHKQSTFFCNDLNGLHGYNNLNSKWKEYYNSAGVVPISNLRGTERKIVGFLCLDGIAGDFENTIIKELLCSYGDLLYVFFEKTNQLAEICANGGIQNAVLEKFNGGNLSR